MAPEPVSFAQDELDRIKNEVLQAMSQNPVNLNQCTRPNSLVIAVYLRFLKVNFNWICSSGPGISDNTCSSWSLAVDT